MNKFYVVALAGTIAACASSPPMSRQDQVNQLCHQSNAFYMEQCTRYYANNPTVALPVEEKAEPRRRAYNPALGEFIAGMQNRQLQQQQIDLQRQQMFQQQFPTYMPPARLSTTCNLVGNMMYCN